MFWALRASLTSDQRSRKAMYTVRTYLQMTRTPLLWVFHSPWSYVHLVNSRDGFPHFRTGTTDVRARAYNFNVRFLPSRVLPSQRFVHFFFQDEPLSTTPSGWHIQFPVQLAILVQRDSSCLAIYLVNINIVVVCFHIGMQLALTRSWTVLRRLRLSTGRNLKLAIKGNDVDGWV